MSEGPEDLSPARDADTGRRGESWASSPATRAVMKGNRRRDTKPEMRIRRLLHARGLRYRVDAPGVPGLRRRADVLFNGARVAVFVDGCYWHGCPAHGTASKTNASYWSSKIEQNRSRDRDTDAQYAAAGWLVLRYWEHEDPASVADAIAAAVAARLRDRSR